MFKQVVKYGSHPRTTRTIGYQRGSCNISMKKLPCSATACIYTPNGTISRVYHHKSTSGGRLASAVLPTNLVNAYALFSRKKEEQKIIRTKFKLPTRYSNKFFSIEEVPNRFSEAASTQVVIDTISYFSKESIERINKLFALEGKNYEQWMEQQQTLENMNEPSVGGVKPRVEEAIEKDVATKHAVDSMKQQQHKGDIQKPQYAFDIGILTSSGTKENLESFTQSLFTHWDLSTRRGFLLHITDRNQVILSVGYEFNHDLYEELETELFHLVNNPRMHAVEKEEALIGLLERFRDADYRWWCAKHSQAINTALLTDHHVFSAFENARWEKLRKTELPPEKPAKPDAFLSLMTDIQKYESSRLDRIRKHNRRQNQFWFISFSVFAALLLLYSMGDKRDRHYRCEVCEANPEASPSIMVPRDLRRLKTLDIPSGLMTEHRLRSSVLEGRICPTCKHEAVYRVKENPRFRDCQRCQFHTVELLPDNELFGYCHHCAYRQPLSEYGQPSLAKAMKSSSSS